MEPARQPADIVKLALELVRTSEVGLLCTADKNGRPHARWMGSVAGDDALSSIVTLTSPTSRKLEHIRENPFVEWVFSDASWDRVVHLRGQAIIIEDPALIKRDWNMILDKSRAYFLRYQESGFGFSVVETHIDEIEYTLPKVNILNRTKFVL